MKSQKALPSGYKKAMTIDLLNNKKLFIRVNVIAIILAAVTFAIGLCINEFHFNLNLIFSVAIIVIYILLHELVHGIFMYFFSRVKPSYGFNLAYAYAGSTAYFSKTHYIIIALAPIVILGIVLAVIGYFTVNTNWFWIFYIVECLNISGAAGDIYVTALLLKLPADILVNDSGFKMIVYQKS